MLLEPGHRCGKERPLLVEIGVGTHQHGRCSSQELQAEQSDVVLVGCGL